MISTARRYKPRESRRRKQPRWKVGSPTGLLDCNGKEISIGDAYTLKGTDYKGVVLYNDEQDCLGLFFRKWYGEDIYDQYSYGKMIEIPKDNGMRMELIPAE